MNKEYMLVTGSKEYKLKLDTETETYKELLSKVPITGEAKVIGGEVLYIIDIDIPFNGKEKEVFDVGDIVYWRSQKVEKFAIAIFYGNTKFGNGDAPTAASPCIRFASIIENCSELESVTPGTAISLIAR